MKKGSDASATEALQGDGDSFPRSDMMEGGCRSPSLTVFVRAEDPLLAEASCATHTSLSTPCKAQPLLSAMLNVILLRFAFYPFNAVPYYIQSPMITYH